MIEIESMLLEIADTVNERSPDASQKIHAAIERLRVWREQETDRQFAARSTYAEAMMTYASGTKEQHDAYWQERVQRDGERLARLVATDRRWQGTYAALVELLSKGGGDADNRLLSTDR